MIRVICVEVDEAAAVNVGGPVHVSHKTFECRNGPTIAGLTHWLGAAPTYTRRSVVGVEVPTPELPDDEVFAEPK